MKLLSQVIQKLAPELKNTQPPFKDKCHQNLPTFKRYLKSFMFVQAYKTAQWITV